LIDKLEDKGYISRVRGEQDRRIVNLELTDFGKEILAKAPFLTKVYYPMRSCD